MVVAKQKVLPSNGCYGHWILSAINSDIVYYAHLHTYGKFHAFIPMQAFSPAYARIYGGHFVFCDFQGLILKIQRGMRQIWNQHTQIRLKQSHAIFYSKMP